MDVRDVLEAGALAGLFAGIAMALFAMIRSQGVGLGFWLPMKLIGGLYYGTEALLGDTGVVLLGIATHLITAMAWGILFAALVQARLTAPAALLVGLGYGALVGLLMSYLILPATNELMFEWVRLGRGWFLASHLVFGATLALTPGLARGFHRRHMQHAASH